MRVLKENMNYLNQISVGAVCFRRAQPNYWTTLLLCLLCECICQIWGPPDLVIHHKSSSDKGQ